MPRNSIAVHRPYAWAKYWKEIGCEVTVLTSEKCTYDEPLDLKLNIIEGVQVIEVPYRSNTLLSNHSNVIAKVKNCFISLLKNNLSLIKKTLRLNYDIRDSWAKSAIPIAVRTHNIKKFDIIVSTFGPRSCHIIGRELKINYPEVFWLADYRDMWSIRHNIDLNPYQIKKERRLELNTVNLADCITTVSPPLAIDLSIFLNKDVHVVYNGYDANLNNLKIKLCNNNKMSIQKRKNINIVYTGIIYPGLQDPTPLFIAINNLISQNKIGLADVCVNFYGHRQFSLQNIIDSNHASSYAAIHGHVDREIALGLQSNADLLLLLESGRPDAKGVVTGKIFEYMIAGNPILSLGSAKESTIGELIISTGVGVICEENIAEIESALLCVIDGKIESIYKPNFAEISLYHRREQSLKLIDTLLEKLNKREKQGA